MADKYRVTYEEMLAVAEKYGIIVAYDGLEIEF